MAHIFNHCRCLALFGLVVMLIQILSLASVSKAASIGGPVETDFDNVYRLLTLDQPCTDDHCLGRVAFKRAPNELVINRENLVTLLRHMYPKAAFTSPFLGKRSWNKIRFDTSAEKR